MQYISDLHSKYALRAHQSTLQPLRIGEEKQEERKKERNHRAKI